LPKDLTKHQRKKIRVLDLTDLIASGDTHSYTDIKNTDSCDKERYNESNGIDVTKIDLILPCLSTIAYNAMCDCNPDLYKPVSAHHPNPGKSVSAHHLVEICDQNNPHIDGDRALISDGKSNKKRKRNIMMKAVDADAVSTNVINNNDNKNDNNNDNNEELFKVIILLRPSKYIINNKIKSFHKILPVLTRTFGCNATSTIQRESEINNILNSWIYDNKKYDIYKKSKIYFKANLFTPLSTKKSNMSESTEMDENRYISPGFAVATLQHWAYHGRLKPAINEGATEYFINSL
jgi:hypothetical protein